MRNERSIRGLGISERGHQDRKHRDPCLIGQLTGRVALPGCFLPPASPARVSPVDLSDLGLVSQGPRLGGGIRFAGDNKTFLGLHSAR